MQNSKAVSERLTDVEQQGCGREADACRTIARLCQRGRWMQNDDAVLERQMHVEWQGCVREADACRMMARLCQRGRCLQNEVKYPEPRAQHEVAVRRQDGVKIVNHAKKYRPAQIALHFSPTTFSSVQFSSVQHPLRAVRRNTSIYYPQHDCFL